MQWLQVAKLGKGRSLGVLPALEATPAADLLDPMVPAMNRKTTGGRSPQVTNTRIIVKAWREGVSSPGAEPGGAELWRAGKEEKRQG